MASNGNGGLNSEKRKWLNFIVASIMSVNASLAGIAASTGVEVSPWVYFALAIAGVIAWQYNSNMAITADKVAASTGPSNPA